jgi:hypothetical protein
LWDYWEQIQEQSGRELKQFEKVIKLKNKARKEKIKTSKNRQLKDCFCWGTTE